MKGLDGSVCLRMGAVVKAVFSFEKASSAAWDHLRCLGTLFQESSERGGDGAETPYKLLVEVGKA